MSSNVRAKIIAAGLATAAAVLLPACAPNAVGGNALSTTAEPTTTSVVTAPAVTTPVAPSSKEEKTIEIPAKYNVMVKSIAAASKDVRAFMAEHGLDMSDVNVQGALKKTDIETCTPASAKSTVNAWACSDATPRHVVAHIPNMYEQVYVPAGNIGVAVVMGHEFGHLALPVMDRRADTNTDLEERRADCVAGSFLAWWIDHGGPAPHQVRNTLLKLYPDTTGVSARRQAMEHGMANGLGSCPTYTDGYAK